MIKLAYMSECKMKTYCVRKTSKGLVLSKWRVSRRDKKYGVRTYFFMFDEGLDYKRKRQLISKGKKP